ncbi:MAG: DUF4276 family protein [Magnetococcales bacterium]|nr:DUF4276 family protein [Magnetococcales bacterium]
MKIAFIVEGETEKMFLPHLRRHLEQRLAGRMPTIRGFPQNGGLPKEEALKRLVDHALRDYDHAVALSDVYGVLDRQGLPLFQNAADAKEKMRQWVGREPRFHPHAAQHDFEAWLLPYSSAIQKLAGSKGSPPGGNPESVNHNPPPAHRMEDLFALNGKKYSKPLWGGRILKDQDLSVAAGQCMELKLLLCTFSTLSL